MNSIDLEHKLLKGSPINFCGIPLYRVTLGEMVDFKYGYSVFNQILGLCLINKENFERIELTNGEAIEGSAFWYFYFNICKELDTNIPLFDYDNEKVFSYDVLIEFLKSIFHNEVTFYKDNGFIIGTENPTVLNDNNFDKFVEILKLRFGMTDVDEIDEDNPVDEFTRSLIEKRNKARERLKEARKSDSDSDLTMADLISIFAESAHVSLQDIYEKYDIYQFNNQFNRLKIMSDYNVGIQSLLAGAKSDDVKLQHWITKIKKKEQ